MTLIGNTYVQDNDPGAVGFGYTWRAPSTGQYSERNTSNTGWVPIYNANANNGGLLPLAGGVMTGAITGAHGLVTSVSPHFTTSAFLNGISLATVNDVSTAIAGVNSSISSTISQAIASLVSSYNISATVAFASGTVHDQAYIPLPSYGGTSGRQAFLSEVRAVIVSPNDETYGTGSQATNWEMKWNVDSNLKVTGQLNITSGGGGSNVGTTVGASTANYLIICMASS